jgi:hypothetical protein
MSYGEAVSYAREARKSYAQDNIELLAIAGGGFFLEATFCLSHWVAPDGTCFVVTGLGLFVLAVLHIDARRKYLRKLQFAKMARRAALQSEIHHARSEEWNRFKSGVQ